MRFELSINEIRASAESVEEAGAFDGQYVHGVATLKEAIDGDLSFLSLAKYVPDLEKTKASVVFVPENCQVSPQQNQLFLKVKHPNLALARACESIAQSLWPRKPGGLHASSIVDSTAEVDETAHLGPFCVVGGGVGRVAAAGADAHHLAVDVQTVRAQQLEEAAVLVGRHPWRAASPVGFGRHRDRTRAVQRTGHSPIFGGDGHHLESCTLLHDHLLSRPAGHSATR